LPPSNARGGTITVGGAYYVLEVRTRDSYRASEMQAFLENAADTAMQSIAKLLMNPGMLSKPTLSLPRRSN